MAVMEVATDKITTKIKAGVKGKDRVVGALTMAIPDMAPAMEVDQLEEVITIAIVVAVHMEVRPAGLSIRIILTVYTCPFQVDMAAIMATTITVVEVVVEWIYK